MASVSTRSHEWRFSGKVEYHSSPTEGRLYDTFLKPLLADAEEYVRVAGYFRSSFLALASREMGSVPRGRTSSGNARVRILCNYDVDPRDVLAAKVADGTGAWEALLAADPFLEAELGRDRRYRHLWELLSDGTAEIRLVPSDTAFIHAKYGFVRSSDGHVTGFLGSVNETAPAYTTNFEAVVSIGIEKPLRDMYADFERFWDEAIPLGEAVIRDLDTKTKPVTSLETWGKAKPEPSPIAVLPQGELEGTVVLWDHQRAFVGRVIEEHLHRDEGFRALLADSVGLGKTAQLGAAGKVIALLGGEVLFLVPAAVAEQWQDELLVTLGLPAARWCGNDTWTLEDGVTRVAAAIDRCPRRVAIVPTSTITNAHARYREALLTRDYAFVGVDESHRVRRIARDAKQKLAQGCYDDAAMNKLMAFLCELGPRCHSLALATATPIQLTKLELFDQLRVLAAGNDAVLGSEGSPWRRDIVRGLAILSDEEAAMPRGFGELMEWLGDPLLPSAYAGDIPARLREAAGLTPDVSFLSPERAAELAADAGLGVLHQHLRGFMESGGLADANPYTARTIRRTRRQMEEKGHLEPIAVTPLEMKVPFRDGAKDCYDLAEEFTKMLGKRTHHKMPAGFIRTMLLRRVCSSLVAGHKTVQKLLEWAAMPEDDPRALAEIEAFLDESGDGDTATESSGKKDDAYDADGRLTAKAKSSFRFLFENEREKLQELQKLTGLYWASDPKLAAVKGLLAGKGGMKAYRDNGCVLFSQFYDTARFYFDSLCGDPDYAGQPVGLYAAEGRTLLWDGTPGSAPTGIRRHDLKRMVQRGTVRLLVGTEAAGEGLNLQALGNAINLDLPFNPTKLDQRQGRVVRPGQAHQPVGIAYFRYEGTVEDRVRELLTRRFGNIYDVFGDIPKAIDEAWQAIILYRDEKAAEKAISRIERVEDRFRVATPLQEERYAAGWDPETARVTNAEMLAALSVGWDGKPGPVANGEPKPVATAPAAGLPEPPKGPGGSYVEAARRELAAGETLSTMELWGRIAPLYAWSPEALTPWTTLGARLGDWVVRGGNTDIEKVGDGDARWRLAVPH